MRKNFFMIIGLLFMVVLAGCGSNAGATHPTPTPTTAQTPDATSGAVTPTATNTNAAFTITKIDMAVSPSSIAGMACGSNVNVVYTATLHAPAQNAGGTAKFDYTVNNGRSVAPGSVTFQPGETTKTFVFNWSGTLHSDNVYPGPGGVQVSAPNQITSQTIKPAGTCALNAPFKVTSVDLTGTPMNIDGMKCGTTVTFTYTAKFHVAPNSPGGTIQFSYTLNNGRAEQPASVKVNGGDTEATYVFKVTRPLPNDHTFPSVAIVMVTGPNNILSPGVHPSGLCH